ncbi:8-oxoguanine deaminase [Sphingomonas oleivorans]|uniref:8-oxoguanine deaminase n=1 Tax=Sphingomonas oleivorans TaxID=1735121 RepID=A0A2T5FZF6_9SPHN|nr:8-oxoguanine deaminase [Sphingomonas oleivorans]PTQ12086.1 8-oxoguanine deaminase [Sphingomonas oleivorans]
MRLWLKNPLAILGPDCAGGLVVDGDVIAELVPAGATPAGPVDEVMDASAHVILPGLVNTHHHFYQNMTRAHPAAINKPLFGWLQALYPIWARITPEALELATEMAMIELMLSGVTTTSDHHYLFPAGMEEAIDIQVEVARRLGMRVTLTRGSMSLSVEDGGLPPRSVVQRDEAILADCERLIARFHERGPGAFVQIALAPCSPFSVTPQLMRESAALAARHGCRLHTHLAETEDENDFCLHSFGRRPLDHLEEVGWLGEQTWLAHGIHFDPSEIERLGRSKVAVCHCPTSNMLLASGQCHTLALEAAGSPVGLGVDGSASNDAGNGIEAVRHALLLNRLRYGADRMTHLDALRWATHGSARCLGRDDIGRLRAGAAADLALFRVDEDLAMSGAHDPLAALVLCGATRADRLMVGGRWLVRDRMPVGIDLASLRDRHHRLARRLYG